MSEQTEHVEIPSTTNEEKQAPTKADILKKRKELIRLSEDGKISQSPQNLKKANERVILKIHAEYEAKQAEKANAFLTDLLISKFSDFLGGLGAVESSKELEKELVNDKLLRKDVKSIVEKLTPFLPYLGILSGGVTVGRHVVKRQILILFIGFTFTSIKVSNHESICLILIDPVVTI